MKKDLDRTPAYNYSVRVGETKPKRKPTAKTKEGKVKVRVREILDSFGTACWYFMPVTKGYSRSGIPDFIGCLSGTMFAIETKSKHSSHKVTSLQQMELRGIREAMGVALVIDEDNVESLRELLNGHSGN